MKLMREAVKRLRGITAFFVKVFIAKNLWLPALLFILGIITFCTYDIFIATDLKTYMKAARQIGRFEGLILADSSISQRGPVFPVMISFAYFLFGSSPWSVFWVIRTFAISNPILIYYLGKKMRGKWVGFFAGLLVITSYCVCRWSYHLLDAIWSFFALLSLFFIIRGFEDGKRRYFPCAGVLMAVAFLTKESAMLFFAAPLLVFLLVRDYRSGHNFRNVILYYLSLFLTILPWVLYLHFRPGLPAITGKAAPAVIDGIIRPTELVGLTGFDLYLSYPVLYFKGFINYYRQISSWIFIAPVLAASWGFVVIRAFRKDKYSIVLLLYLVLYSPILYFLGYSGWSPRQGIIIFLLSYLAAADFLWTSGLCIYSGFNRLEQIQRIRIPKYSISLCILATMVIVQTTISRGRDKGYREFLKRSFFYQWICKGNRQFVVRKNERFVYAKKWIEENIPPGSRVMWDKPEQLPSYFKGVGIEYYELPYIRLEKSGELSEKSAKNVILIESESPADYINILTEEELIESVVGNRIDYIVAGWRKHYLRLYFGANSSFVELKKLCLGKITIYKAVPPLEKAGDFKTFIDERVVSHVNNLKKENSKEFDWYKNKYFNGVLGWNEAQFREFLSLNKTRITEHFIMGRYKALYPAGKYKKFLLRNRHN